MNQDIQGVILIDKAAAMTSAKMVSRVKSLLGLKKAGHAGTLDPFATGLMICFLNRATRLAAFLLHGTKTYEAVLELGISTDTQDFTGNPVESRPVPDFSTAHIEATFGAFTGTLLQTPPVYSALKHKGRPLYRYARRGKPVQKPPRRVTISKIELLDIRLPRIRFSVSCSAGTYIRTLCADIGKSLGCGGHLKSLRRIESCGFSVADAFTLEQLEKMVLSGDVQRHVIPMAVALKGMLQRTADASLKHKILNGVPLPLNEIPPDPALENGDLVKVIDEQNRLLAVLTYKKGRPRYDYCCVFN
jgi:tRNA pseudouridine55 synthase